jgi:large subunit ribosomal protein L10
MRPEKQLLLDDIKGKIEGSQAFILTRYQKMNPNMASDFRNSLAKTGGDFEIMRKRILMKAAKAAGIQFEPSQLKGHIGLIFAVQDPILTTKAVFKFKQENEDVLEIMGGRFEGRLYSGKDVEQLSKLPAKPEMQAQLLGVFEAVPAQTLGVIDALLSSLMYCLDNKSKT